MKEILQSYTSYNLWANKILIDKALTLPEEMIHKDMESSFPSIYATFVHLMEVESIWWQRLALKEHVEIPEKDAEQNLQLLSKQLLFLSKQWADWTKNANEKNITHVFGYQNSKMEYFKQPVFEALIHLCNHQTYHRGQIVTMMRQNKIEKIPATDFIAFSRKK